MATITFTQQDQDHDHVCDLNHEFLQTDTLLHCQNSNSPQQSHSNRWRQIFLALRAHKLLSSIFHKATNTSLTISEIISTNAESLPYTNIPTNAAAAADSQNPPVGDQLKVRLDIQDDDTTNTCNIERAVPLSNVITSDSCNFVKERNSDSLHKSGEINNDDAENDGRIAAYGSNIYRETLNPATALFDLVYKPVKDWTMLLLFCSAALFLVSDTIPEKGVRKGWYKGTTIFIFITIVIVASTICIYWLPSKRKELIARITWVTSRVRALGPFVILMISVVSIMATFCCLCYNSRSVKRQQ